MTGTEIIESSVNLKGEWFADAMPKDSALASESIALDLRFVEGPSRPVALKDIAYKQDL
jgi:hypothetical protein